MRGNYISTLLFKQFFENENFTISRKKLMLYAHESRVNSYSN